VSEALQTEAADLFALPLPPTSGPYAEPPISAPAPAPAAVAEEPPAPLRPAEPEPAAEDLEALRAKVAEQAHVISLAKTRVETLLEEKRESYEREQALQQRILALEAELTQTLAPAASTEVPTLAGLAARVAALEAAVADR